MAAFFVTIILLLPFACYVIRLTLCPFREKKTTFAPQFKNSNFI